MICRDDLGKEAVAESVKKIVLENLDDPAGKGVTLKDGAVIVRCAWGKGSDGYFTDSEIHRAIERAL